MAALYAMGYSPIYIYLLFQRYAKEMVSMDFAPIFSGFGGFVKNKKIQIEGFNNGMNIEKEYTKLALQKGVKEISEIKMPLIIPSVDIKTAKKYIFTNCKPRNKEEKNKYISNIPVGTAVRASSSFPGIFCPCKFKEHQFLDGGILDNIPVKEVKNQGSDVVIAVNFKADEVDEESNVMDITMKTIDIMGNKISEEDLKYSDYILTVETDKVGLLDFTKLKDCYESGYQAGYNAIKDITDIMNNKRKQ